MSPVGREGDEHPFLTLERDLEPRPVPVTSVAMKNQRSTPMCLAIQATPLIVQQDGYGDLARL